MRLLPIASLLILSGAGAIAVACGSSSASNETVSSSDAAAEGSTGTVDEAGSTDAGVEAAPYPAFVATNVPQVPDRGGPVMALPKVVPVFYATDDSTITASIQDFVNKLGATDYWQGAVGEYNVGQVVGEPGIQLSATDNPPSTFDDSQIQEWLASKLEAPDSGFPVPDANTIYTLFFPSGITITTGGGPVSTPDGGADASAGGGGGANVQSSCTDFGGYHSVIKSPGDAGSAYTTYAVVPRCASFDGFTGIDAVTGPASHEIVESSTDPLVREGPAYYSIDSAHHYWGTMYGGGELGDMCAQNLGSFVKFPDLPYLVQRIWSNKAALAGTDPCTPVPAGEVYFNTIPVLPNTTNTMGHGLDGGTTTIATQVVQIAVGSSKTIELDLFSSAPQPLGPWSVAAYDEYDLQLVSSRQLKFSLDKTSGENGDKLHLTIDVVSAGPGNQEAFLLVSGYKSGQENLWVGLVAQ